MIRYQLLINNDPIIHNLFLSNNNPTIRYLFLSNNNSKVGSDNELEEPQRGAEELHLLDREAPTSICHDQVEGQN